MRTVPHFVERSERARYEAVKGWLAEGQFLLHLANPAFDQRQLKLVWCFNPLLTSAMGKACYPDRPDGVYRIELSLPLWDRAGVQEQRETVMHELCHVVAFVLHGERCGHQEPWRKLMRDLRLRPERCHHVCTAGVKAL